MACSAILCSEEPMPGLLTAQTTEKSTGRGFSDFYKDHYPIMYRLAQSITGSREDAQDVVHLVFSRILRRDFTAAFLKNPKRAMNLTFWIPRANWRPERFRSSVLLSQ